MTKKFVIQFYYNFLKQLLLPKMLDLIVKQHFTELIFIGFFGSIKVWYTKLLSGWPASTLYICRINLAFDSVILLSLYDL